MCPRIHNKVRKNKKQPVEKAGCVNDPGCPFCLTAISIQNKRTQPSREDMGLDDGSEVRQIAWTLGGILPPSGHMSMSGENSLYQIFIYVVFFLHNYLVNGPSGAVKG